MLYRAWGSSGGEILERISEREMTCRAWIKKKEAQIPDCRNVQVLTQSLREWTKEQFAAVDAMIFIGATGIAVRSIAPYVRSKKTDPAVIVVDEQGRMPSRCCPVILAVPMR